MTDRGVFQPLDITLEVGVDHEWNGVEFLHVLELGGRDLALFGYFWVFVSLVFVVQT